MQGSLTQVVGVHCRCLWEFRNGRIAPLPFRSFAFNRQRSVCAGRQSDFESSTSRHPGRQRFCHPVPVVSSNRAVCSSIDGQPPQELDGDGWTSTHVPTELIPFFKRLVLSSGGEATISSSASSRAHGPTRTKPLSGAPLTANQPCLLQHHQQTRHQHLSRSRRSRSASSNRRTSLKCSRSSKTA